MKSMFIVVPFLLSACTALETRPVKVTTVNVPGSISVAGAVINGSAEARADVAAAPVLKAGQQWTYRRMDLWRKEEVERFRQELLFEDIDRWTVRWTILSSDDAARRGSVTSEVMDPSNESFADSKMKGRYEPLRFPLASGKSWSFDYRIRSQSGNEVRVTQTATAKSWETVSVPAGSFRALRVQHDGRYTTSEGGYSWSSTIQEIYWYAPSARRVVKREYRDTKGDGSTWDQWRDELVDMRL
jgi:hypothetical protein